MANVLAGAFAVVGVIVMLSSLLVWTAYMLPRRVTRAQAMLEAHPWQSFFAGLAVLAIAGGTYFLALSMRAKLRAQIEILLDTMARYAGVARYCGDAGTLAHELLYVVIIPFAIAIIIGGAAFAKTFAQRADTKGDRPLRSLIGGAFTMSASMFLPLVGWFVFLPIITLMSAGSGMLSLLARDQVPQV
jgi:hypothetical protein